MELDPQSRAVVDRLNASGVLPFRNHDPVALRELSLKLRPPRPAEPTTPMAKVREETITTPDGAFQVRIYWPRQLAERETMGAVIYFHGGGFFIGGLDESDESVRAIAAKADVIAVSVDYHLSPEARFPVAVNDAYAALCWVVRNAARLGVDPARIVLSGDSAGGNLTLVTALMARERGGPAIAFQAPIYPSLDMRPRPAYGSRRTWGAGGYILDNDDIAWMLGNYLTDPAEGDDWRASPILAASYAALPPALVITADHDPLCDEGKLYADRLAADGVAAEYACFEATFHGFVGYAAFLEVGARAVDLLCDRIRRALAVPEAAIAVA
ncbi:MAG TPA: alpha/beta hydrolase [Caulobacteraceae bacterium]|nr:alpha/beta hydrolase [Caulobacteraceae bacterium]